MITIESRDNARIKRVCKLQSDSGERRAQGLFVCEGEVMLREAISAGTDIREVYMLPAQRQIAGLRGNAACMLITQPVLERMSEVKTSRGPIFVCAMPVHEQVQGEALIALENMRDPGNMGTVLRTAEAFSMKQVICVGSCVDVYSPKVVRSTMGAIFRMPVTHMTTKQLYDLTRQRNLELFGAALSNSAQSVYDVDLQNCAVVIGSEAHGLSEEMLSLCDKQVKIGRAHV